MFYFGLDLAYEREGIIDDLDQNKYCDLMVEISENSSSSLQKLEKQ